MSARAIRSLTTFRSGSTSAAGRASWSEPQAKLAALYPLLRPRDIVIEALVGRDKGLSSFHVFDRFHGLSSISQDAVVAAANLGEQARTTVMPMRTLAEICRTHAVDVIDFLKIDVEGAELGVLEGNDWSRFRPKIVLLEAIAPGTGLPAWDQFEPLLLGKGYRFALFDTLNRFYVADEHPEILARFSGGRADWDAARHMYEIGRAPLNEAHPEHRLARDLAKGLWASLTTLDAATLVELLSRSPEFEGDPEQLRDYLASEQGQLALGRIACGFDGGQIYPEKW